MTPTTFKELTLVGPRLALVAAILALLPTWAEAQTLEPEDIGSYPVGFRLITVSGQSTGNPLIQLRVQYPATVSGEDVPLEFAGAPYGLVVFAHAFGTPAVVYDSLGTHHASRGTISVSVATEEGTVGISLARLARDVESAVLGMRQMAVTATSPLVGAVSPTTKAIFMGHGFGGTAAILAASARPDLCRGVITLAAHASHVHNQNVTGALQVLAVPTLHVGASDDLMIPPAQNLTQLYSGSSTTGRLIEIQGANHSSFHEAYWYDRLLEPPPAIGLAEQQRLTRRYTMPFIEWQLYGRMTDINKFLGPSAKSDPQLASQATRLKEALLFASGPAMLGSVLEIHAARLPTDLAFLAVALQVSPALTTYGISYLDVSTRVILPPIRVEADSFASLQFFIPPWPQLQGTSFPCQAFIANGFDAQLSNLWMVEIH